MDETTRAAMKDAAFTIWLKAPVDILLGRVRKRQEHDQTRPLLANGDMRGTLERLLAAREPVYATADMVLESADEPHAVLLDKIVAALALTWDMRRRHERDHHGRPGRARLRHPCRRAACWRSAGELLKPLAQGRGAGGDRQPCRRNCICRPCWMRCGKAGIDARPIVMPPGEVSKSFAGLETAHRRAAGSWRSTASGLVIALGGGVIGDLTGFAAGVLKRGVAFAQIPTTLLAQVDSSVGGKTAINAPQGKNLIGLFHQPRIVIADTALLATLPRRELLAGYAEVVKYGALGDAQFFEWLEANGRQGAGRRREQPWSMPWPIPAG